MNNITLQLRLHSLSEADFFPEPLPLLAVDALLGVFLVVDFLVDFVVDFFVDFVVEPLWPPDGDLDACLWGDADFDAERPLDFEAESFPVERLPAEVLPWDFLVEVLLALSLFSGVLDLDLGADFFADLGADFLALSTIAVKIC